MGEKEKEKAEDSIVNVDNEKESRSVIHDVQFFGDRVLIELQVCDRDEMNQKEGGKTDTERRRVGDCDVNCDRYFLLAERLPDKFILVAGGGKEEGVLTPPSSSSEEEENGGGAAAVPFEGVEFWVA